MPIGSSPHRTRLAVLAVLLLVSALTAGCGAGRAVKAGLPTVQAVNLDTDTVDTAAGTVRGLVHADHRVFAGIRYAAAPVGERRWRPAEPVAPWSGVRDAVKPGPWCMQPGGEDTVAAPESAEDCLSLNVWTPTGTVVNPRPVLVWIHGGSFVRGSGDIYQAQRLAAVNRIVVVTINYRLGALGFLADPALGEPGNYGLTDQQAALRWVRDNIGAFGGDPAKVTIAGESAGAMSICDHLAAPDSAGLYRAAIIQSGPCQAQVDVETGRRISAEYTAAAGCPARPDRRAQAACLRALPAAKLVKPLWYAKFGNDRLSGPVLGAPSLPVDPVALLTAGDGPAVPVLLGITRDEFTLFEALRYLRERRELTAADYPAALADSFGAGLAPAVAEHYPPNQYGGSASLAYAAAATDDIFACLADRMAAGLRRSAPAVFAYEFDDPHAPAPEMYAEVPFPLGASHALDLRYLFDIGGAPALTGDQRELSDQMTAYWGRFVIAGAPDVAGAPDWPAVGDGVDGDRWMSLRPDGSRIVTDFAADHQCGFWAGVRG